MTVDSTNGKVPYMMADAHGGGDQCTYRIRDAMVQRDSPDLVATSGVPQYKVEAESADPSHQLPM